MTLQEALQAFIVRCSAIPLEELQKLYDQAADLGEWKSDRWGNKWLCRRHRSLTSGLLEILGIDFAGKATGFRKHLLTLGIVLRGVDARFTSVEESERRSAASVEMHRRWSPEKKKRRGEKIAAKLQGVPHGPLSEDHRRKIGKAHKQIVRTSEWCEAISRSLSGKSGHKHTPESRRKSSVSQRKRVAEGRGFVRHREDSKKKMSESAIARLQNSTPAFQIRQTDIELAFERAADMRLFQYVGYFPKDGSNDHNRRHLIPGLTPDFVCPSKKIAVWLDGCYWHGCPECFPNGRFSTKASTDAAMNEKARSMGWKVLRLWGHQVLGRPPDYIQKNFIEPLM